MTVPCFVGYRNPQRSFVKRQCATSRLSSQHMWPRRGSGVRFTCNAASSTKLDFSFSAGNQKFFPRKSGWNWHTSHISNFPLPSFIRRNFILTQPLSVVYDEDLWHHHHRCQRFQIGFLWIVEDGCFAWATAAVTDAAGTTDAAVNQRAPVEVFATRTCFFQSIRFASQDSESVVIFGSSRLVSRLLPPRWVKRDWSHRALP